MTRLAKSFMSIPLSSCHLERLFAQIKYNKTQSRNRMEQKTLEAILFHKENKELSEEIAKAKLTTKEMRKLFDIDRRCMDLKNYQRRLKRRIKIDDVEQENDNESNNSSEDSCEWDYDDSDNKYLQNEENSSDDESISIVKGIERLSLEKQVTENTKLYDQKMPNLRRKRDEYEKDQIKTETFMIVKQYTLDKFFPIK